MPFRVTTYVKQLSLLAGAFPQVRRRYGLARALELGLHELLFDPRHSSDTSIKVQGQSGPEHEPCNPLIFNELMRGLPVNARDGAFLDFGAGKGRVLLLAAEHGFSRVIGVEISRELCAVADANVVALDHPGEIEVHCADCADFEIPDSISVGFFFNPFGPDVMAAALDRICDSLDRAPREFWVLYVYPRCRALFEGRDFYPVDGEGSDGLVLRRRR